MPQRVIICPIVLRENDFEAFSTRCRRKRGTVRKIMKAADKIKGIAFAYNTTGEYDMVHDLGVEWMRAGISFPWKDGMYGTLTTQYLDEKAEIHRLHEAGFQIMTSLPGMGCYLYDEGLKKTVFKDSFPDFVGAKGTEEYYDNIRRAASFIVRDLGEDAGIYFQCMNEIDNPVFSGGYPTDVITRTARTIAEGVLEARPDARCGINLSQYYGPDAADARRVADLVYAPGHKFYYFGIDQYFGSWQPGKVSDWIPTIDQAWQRYHLPVLANEWGYSSGGEYSEKRPDPSLIPEGLTEICYAKKWFNQVEGGHTPETQAAYFREGLKIFAEHPHCLGSFMFCWRDAYHCYHCGAEDCPAEDYWGLVTRDLRPKPAYYAVKEALKEYYA